MVEQQQRSPGLATLAALCLLSQLAFYGLLAGNTCSGETCGYALLGSAYLLLGTGVVLGVVAWLGATVRAVCRHDVTSALGIGVLPVVAISNALLVNSHNVNVEQASGVLVLDGAWALFIVIPTILLAISLTSRQSIQRVVAVAGLVLAVVVLVASNVLAS
jgi:hypothetical protein